MTKKTKVVEIKSVPTEPQRGAGEGADPNDPVGIYYPFGGIARLIGSLAGGDEDEAVIKTGGTIVEHDINVRYRAPSGPSFVPAAVTLPESFSGFIEILYGKRIILEPYPHLSQILVEGNQNIVPVIWPGESDYRVTLELVDETHEYDLTINNTLVEYDNGVHEYEYVSSTYPESFTVVLTARTPSR